MPHRITLISGLLLGILVAVASHADPFTLYVARDGNDAWSGQLAEPNSGQSDGPLATLQAARDRLRAARAAGSVPSDGAQILIREGNYPMDDALRLTSEDSGTSEAPVIWSA